MSKKLCGFLLLLMLPILSLTASAQKVANSACSLTAIVADDTSSGALKIISKSTATTTPVYVNGVAQTNPAGPRIRICTVKFHLIQPASPANYGFVTGTGTNCGTGQANLTPQFVGTASTTEDWTQFFGPDAPMISPTGVDVCIKLSAAPTHAQVIVTYAIL